MPPARSALATRPMPSIPLDNAEVVLVDHGAGAGFGIMVDGTPIPNLMLLPAGQAERYNVIVGGVFSMTAATDEVLRWAPVLARAYQTLTGSINGHANGAAKPAARRGRPAAATATGTPRRARAGPATSGK